MKKYYLAFTVMIFFIDKVSACGSMEKSFSSYFEITPKDSFFPLLGLVLASVICIICLISFKGSLKSPLYKVLLGVFFTSIFFGILAMLVYPESFFNSKRDSDEATICIKNIDVS